jgi:hypothetical protein
VVEALVRGNAGIAAQLYLSESSVEEHVNAIFTKLGLSAEQLSHRRITAVLTFLRDAGLRGCGAEQVSLSLSNFHLPSIGEMRRTWPPANLAIVALLSQLTFAGNTPIASGCRARNAPSQDVAWVS